MPATRLAGHWRKLRYRGRSTQMSVRHAPREGWLSLTSFFFLQNRYLFFLVHRVFHTSAHPTARAFVAGKGIDNAVSATPADSAPRRNPPWESQSSGG